ncbi:MAG: glycosyltransferase [Deltaproteobacteria bacterium]|nr:glycosyltransferase [Deltaproteobacteria bacterium]
MWLLQELVALIPPPQQPNPMTKACIVRPTLSTGGADRVTLTLMRELPKHGIAPELILLRKEGATLDRAVGTVHSLEARSLWTSVPPLARLLRRLRPDVLFSTSSGTNVPALLAWELLGKPFRVVLSERNVLFHGGYTTKRVALAAAKRLLYPRADQVTVISGGIGDQLVQELRLPREKISVVFNPVVTEELHMGAKAPVAHRFFDGSAPVILGVGRFVKEKAFDVLLRAFAIVRREHGARLLLLGEGPLRGPLELLAQELGIAEHIDMPGFDPNPFKYMARASVFVLTSEHEGLPGVLIQAMACGTPVISTDCPAGPSEIIERPGQDGFLVPVGDVAQVAARMSELLSNSELRCAIGAGGRTASKKFEVDASMRLYLEAIWPGSQRAVPNV